MLTAAATHAARPTSSPTVAGNEDSQSTADHQDSLLPSMPEDLTQSMGTSARTAAQRRRWAMNARHRANDVEFAFEIGSGLLPEVRRLQALLADRDKALQQLTQEKDHFERTADAEARRVDRDLTTARESGEEHKAESERFNIASQDVLAKYNGDVAQLKREISDLQIALDVCRAEAVQKAATVHQAGDESATSSSNKRNSPNTWRKWRKKMFSSV
ncbi:hypothetical protein BKA62DRAFT_715348 [Auriculariales sp. MPI-PUGE-AT-0066]|nr:hypothetical protein BKA62DRAFT_715348 [Auriculariales sp. MPI-PUGE-AT-0066]